MAGARGRIKGWKNKREYICSFLLVTVPMCMDPLMHFILASIPVSTFFPKSQTSLTAIPHTQAPVVQYPSFGNFSSKRGPTPSFWVLVTTPSSLFSPSPRASSYFCLSVTSVSPFHFLSSPKTLLTNSLC